jgi:hypothetical protein
MAPHKKQYTIASLPVTLGEQIDGISRKLSPPPKRALTRSETSQMLVNVFEYGPSKEESEAVTTPSWTLASLPIDEETKTLLQEGMQVSGAEDVVTFLVGAARKEANLVLGQQKRREPSLYESLPTSDLSRIKLPEAT